MSDDTERNRPRAPEPEPEPEGGPNARTEAFLEERLTRLRPRDEDEEAERRGGPPAGPEPAEPEAKGLRQRIIDRYRAAQSAQSPRARESRRGPAGAREDEAEDEPPPQQPS